MTESSWRRFENTGSVTDYLSYSYADGQVDTGYECKDSVKECRDKDGADHNAYRDRAGSGTGRGI